MISLSHFKILFQMLFLVRVTSTEYNWVSLAEGRQCGSDLVRTGAMAGAASCWRISPRSTLGTGQGTSGGLAGRCGQEKTATSISGERRRVFPGFPARRSASGPKRRHSFPSDSLLGQHLKPVGRQPEEEAVGQIRSAESLPRICPRSRRQALARSLCRSAAPSHRLMGINGGPETTPSKPNSRSERGSPLRQYP